MHFALRLVELYQDLVGDKQGQPSLPQDVPSAEATFESMAFEDMWPEANVIAACHYVRGGTRLGMPDSFRPLVPTSL